jgi:hypothetical protein
MAFLRIEDYYPAISLEHLNQILEQSVNVSGDRDVLLTAELRSISRAKEYLTARYKVDRIFKDFLPFSISSNYTYGDRINWTAPPWVNGVYAANSLVSYNGFVYKKNATTAGYTAATLPNNITYFDNVGEESVYYVAFPPEYDEDKVYASNELLYYSHEVYEKNSETYDESQLPIIPTDKRYFKRITPSNYSAVLTVNGVYPTNPAWTYGDNRNQTIVECIAHMAINKIHSIINPRNIPALRRDNFSTAIETLKEFQIGSVQADMPDKEGAQTGYAIRFGSNQPTTHGY